MSTDDTTAMRQATERLIGEALGLDAWLRSALIRHFEPANFRTVFGSLWPLLARPTANQLTAVATTLIAAITDVQANDRPVLAGSARAIADAENATAGLWRALGDLVDAVDRHASARAALRPHLDRLGEALDALDVAVRLALVQQTLTAGTRSSTPVELRSVWLALHVAANGGATTERLDDLVTRIELMPADHRAVLSAVAGRAVDTDPLRAEMWAALKALVDALDPPPPGGAG